MIRFQRFQATVRVALAAATSALAVLLLDAVSKILGGRLLGGLVSVLAVSILALIGSAFLDTAVANSVRLRRWIAGNDFIEGWWFDLAIPPDKRACTHAAIQRIAFRHGEFHVTGTSYLRNGEQLATWSSIAAVVTGRTLFIVYEAQTNLLDNGYERGLVQLQFDDPPNSYSGSMHDFSGQVVRRLRGERLTGSALTEFNNLQSKSDRVAFLRSRVPEWKVTP